MHTQGLAPNDLKASDILICREGMGETVAKVTDFGIRCDESPVKRLFSCRTS